MITLDLNMTAGQAHYSPDRQSACGSQVCLVHCTVPRIQADSAEGVQQSHTHTSGHHRVNCMVNYSQDTLVGFKSSLTFAFVLLHKHNVFVSVCILHEWLIAIITHAVNFFYCCSVSQQTRKTLQQCYNIWTSGIERKCILL